MTEPDNIPVVILTISNEAGDAWQLNVPGRDAELDLAIETPEELTRILTELSKDPELRCTDPEDPDYEGPPVLCVDCVAAVTYATVMEVFDLAVEIGFDEVRFMPPFDEPTPWLPAAASVPTEDNGVDLPISEWCNDSEITGWHPVLEVPLKGPIVGYERSETHSGKPMRFSNIEMTLRAWRERADKIVVGEDELPLPLTVRADQRAEWQGLRAKLFRWSAPELFDSLHLEVQGADEDD